MLNDILTGKASLEPKQQDGPFRAADRAPCRGCASATPKPELVNGYCRTCVPDPYAKEREFDRRAHQAAADGARMAQQNMRDTSAVWLVIRILLVFVSLAIAASR